ncbi:MAG: hypothetical protein R3176_01420 [Woeseiaceae bacterium]|nr:hypothetical protein [Woeseiaceae bacterium]
MERIVQLLDDLDDLVSSIGLARERLRTIAVWLCCLLAFGACLGGGILLAVNHPPLALAAAMLLFTGLLYHAVTSAHGLPARH